MKKTALLVVALFAFVSLAQDVPAAPVPAMPVVTQPAVPGFGEMLLGMLLSPSGLGTIATVIGGVLALIFGANEVRRRRVALAVYHAFHVVEDFSAETDTNVDDKIAAGLKALDTYMLSNGWRPLKPGEVELAKMGFTALNGQTKVAEKIAANAQVEAVNLLAAAGKKAVAAEVAKVVDSVSPQSP